MLDVVIVDDEPIILEGIQSIINWEEIGMRIVATASNGEMGVDVIRRYNPDIVITDVHMNFMDGLEMIRTVQDFNGNIEFIVISAYREFDYAKCACELGVNNYVLKPIEKKVLLKCLLDLRDKINEEQQIKEQINCMESLMNKETPILIDQLTRDILLNRVGLVNINEKMALYGLDSNTAGEYVTSVIAIDLKETESVLNRQLLVFSVKKLAEELFSREYHIMTTVLQREKVGMLIGKDKFSEEDTKKVDELLLRLNRMMKRHLDVSLYTARGDYVMGIENVPISYEISNNCLEYGMCFDSDFFITSESVSAITQQKFQAPYNARKRILECIKYNHNVKADLEAFVSEVIGYGRGYHHVLVSIVNLYVQIVDEMNEFETDDAISEEVSERIRIMMDKPINEVKRLLYEGISLLQAHRNQKNSEYVNGWMKYLLNHIDDHCLLSDFSVANVADYMNMNSAYLGQVFKKNMGESVSQYINKQRIQKAKELLKTTNRLVYEIGNEVGYQNNPAYFNVVFKKLTGLTPADYRKSCI